MDSGTVPPEPLHTRSRIGANHVRGRGAVVPRSIHSIRRGRYWIAVDRRSTSRCAPAGLDTLTPRQIRDRARQLQHPMTLAPALRTFGVALQVPVYAARSGSSAEHLHCTACAAWCRAGVHLLSLHILSRYVDPCALASAADNGITRRPGPLLRSLSARSGRWRTIRSALDLPSVASGL